jgi:hypothetical protein
MSDRCETILSPVGAVGVRTGRHDPTPRNAGSKPVIGLLNNSKPNVAYFLEAIADELRKRGEYETVTITKPRSAAAAPNIEAIAEQCDFVINAVAD